MPPSVLFDIRARKRMSDCVAGLHKAEQWEVYRILHAGGLNHTRNKYGLFFDVTNAPDDVLSRVQSFLDFVHDSRAYLNRAEDVLHGEGAPTKADGNYPDRGDAPVLVPPRGDPTSTSAQAPEADFASRAPTATLDDGSSDRAKKAAAGADAPEVSSLTREQAKQVQLFVQSMVKLRDENPSAKRRETSRFQAYRKKYSRPITQKTSPALACSQLRPEAFTDDEGDD
jgi:hypothetical protein